jgi:hypothetical protein
MTTLEEQLEELIGKEGMAVLKEVAASSGRKLDEMVTLEELDETLGSVEVFSGVNRGPLNFVVLDNEGDEIDLDLDLEESTYGGYKVSAVYDDTVMSKGLPATLGAALGKIFEAKLKLTKLTQNKKDHERQLKKIQTSMTNLGEVFGFDTYEHLEMFMAAWLMKDSTCRLSGIPGTGKTTVIESAAVLLCNSYGHSGKKRFVVSEGKTYDEEARFNQPYVPKEFPAGQNYAIDYSNDAYFAVRDNWNKWRFTRWTEDSQVSGSYLYDNSFLHANAKNSKGDSFNKNPMSIEDYYYLLTNCYVAKVPIQGFNHPDPENKDLTASDILKLLPDNEVEITVAPIQILNEKGEFVFNNTREYKVTDSTGKVSLTYTMGLQFPAYNADTPEPTQNYRNIVEDRPGAGGYARDSIKEYLVAGHGLYTDAGRNEGYNFREFLMNHFYDLRADWIPNEEGAGGKYNDTKSILEEMLREIGVAKIDYEKRADEVLYGIEIRQATKQNELRGVEESTYEFEPVPRPIVTQPVKFFNEANRSQAGVEDAVLGLIAERKVEYRGRSFDSPSFVAWMDTNPHQKGNDLAFIDRIDMELLFKSISLGARYEQLSGKVLGGGGPPQERLVVKAIQGQIEPLRFDELASVWNFVGKDIGYAPPGQTVGSSTYDALREMSYISVLFTQRFQPLNTSLYAAAKTDLQPKSSNYLYASPLMDFSITTNTKEDGASKIRPDREKGKTYESHAPSDIGRVLGFRFTNSLQKLSSSLAFLRGKSYVTRSEILDALPYVTAHRLGRAKSSKGEISGLNGDELNYNNEQEWIREAIVNGYLLQTTEVGVSSGKYPLLDVWDLFYRRCMDVLRSAQNLWTYEKTVLVPLRNAMMKPSAGNNFTPVHWHIATMVIENERAALNTPDSATKPSRTYVSANDYTENYNNYLGRVSYDPNPEKDTSAQVLFDYYQLRGDICSEPNLFSDDRDTLLSLLDSNMAPICGGPVRVTEKGIANRIAIGKQKDTWSGLTKKGFNNDTDSFQWRTYQDSIGAWGRMLQAPGNAGEGGKIEGNRFEENQMRGLSYASSFADQALMVSARLPIREITSKKGKGGAGSLSRDTFVDQLTKLSTSFQTSIGGGGVKIENVEGNEDSIQNIDFADFMSGVIGWANGYTNRNETEFDENRNEIETFEGLSGKLSLDGIMACFPLNHAAGSPTGQTDYDGEDQLRLWVRFFMSEMSGGFATLNLTMGVTSNLISSKKFLKINNEMAYTPSSYTGTVEDGVKDSGNISLIDSLHYQLIFNEATSY